MRFHKCVRVRGKNIESEGRGRGGQGLATVRLDGGLLARAMAGGLFLGFLAVGFLPCLRDLAGLGLPV